MLKIVEVVVLIGAGLCFVAWQFRDLRRSREVTRKQREDDHTQAMNAASEARLSPDKRDADGG
jgi:hypothetical protein